VVTAKDRRTAVTLAMTTFDADAVERLLGVLQNEHRCHVTVREHWAVMATR
jgi:hypothetical protein